MWGAVVARSRVFSYRVLPSCVDGLLVTRDIARRQAICLSSSVRMAYDVSLCNLAYFSFIDYTLSNLLLLIVKCSVLL